MQLSHSALFALNSMVPRTLAAEAVSLVATGRVSIAAMQQVGETLAAEGVIEDPFDFEPCIVELYVHPDNSIGFSCDCEAEQFCVHASAVFLLVFDRAVRPQQVPEWRRSLDSALPAVEGREPSAQLCLFVTVRPGYRGYAQQSGPETALALRPGMMGAKGKWIKGQAKWGGLDRLHAASGHLRALREFERLQQSSRNYFYWGGNQEWLALEDLPGDEVWSAIERAIKVGLPLVSFGAEQRPVVLSEQVLEVTGVVSQGAEGLALAAEFRADGLPLALDGVQMVGQSPVAIAQVEHASARNEQITLHRLDRELSVVGQQLLLAADPLTVPVADRETFETQYLPRMLAELPFVSPDASYEIPAAPRTVLRLTVDHGETHTHLSWEWHRPTGMRNAEEEQTLLALLREGCGAHAGLLWPSATADPAPGGQPTALPADASLGVAASAQFLTEALPVLREIDDVEVTEHGDGREYRAAAESPIVSVRSENEGDWFDLHFTVTIEGEEVEFAELFTALALGDPVFVLPSGTYFPLDRPEFARLREIVEEARALTDQPATGVRVNRHQVDLWDELSELGIVAAQEAQWWLAVQSLGESDEIETVDQPPGLHAQLRDYQQRGVAWLHFLRTHGLGGILADDMGLGKTLQAIAMMELAREERGERDDMPPFLVVAPTSVVGNWRRECERFAPGLRVETITSMAGRRGRPLAEAVAGAHVVVTSYALFRGEADDYRDLEWSGLILDEAQQIKNHLSRGYRAARTLGAPFTLVVTGTPIENNLLELWALSALAAPGLLGTRQRFTDYFRAPIEKQKDGERLALLQRRLGPFLLRRTKDLVASELPPKQEQVLEIELHPKHRKLYDVRFQRERQKLLGLIADVKGNSFQIFQSLTLLRQLALDPALVGEGAVPSAKLDALVELLAEAAEEGHRVLVLSQFTRFLASARDRAADAGLASQYLDGSTTERQRVIDEFREGSDPVFFVSLKAGGFGLNLVEADYVVLLDPWWNPAVEAQAIDRTHRIGQIRPVFVYRLVAANTIEEKVIALREAKAELFERVLGGTGEAGGGTLTAAEIRELLE
ncbi:MAG: SNF2-related protein [Leucobacter sp.]